MNLIKTEIDELLFEGAVFNGTDFSKPYNISGVEGVKFYKNIYTYYHETLECYYCNSRNTNSYFLDGINNNILITNMLSLCQNCYNKKFAKDPFLTYTEGTYDHICFKHPCNERLREDNLQKIDQVMSKLLPLSNILEPFRLWGLILASGMKGVEKVKVSNFEVTKLDILEHFKLKMGELQQEYMNEVARKDAKKKKLEKLLNKDKKNSKNIEDRIIQISKPGNTLN